MTTVSACEKTVVMAKHPKYFVLANHRSNFPLIIWLPLTWALDVHEVGVGGLYKALELVLLFLVLRRGIEEINGESLRRIYHRKLLYNIGDLSCHKLAHHRGLFSGARN